MIQTPNIDIANEGDLAGTLDEVLQAFKRDKLDDMLPAVVEAYDATTNRAKVRPIVKMFTTDGQELKRASVASIPVFRFGAGGFFIAMPVKAGDYGWIKANDRDISLVLQAQMQDKIPNTATFHSFSNAMFFPDTFRQWVIAPTNAQAMVLQSLDGTVCIAIHSNKITVNAPTVEVTSPLTKVTGNITMTGTLTVTGPVITTGTVTNNGKNIGSTHQHSGVLPGMANTGGPV
jgi:hypothetical protein